MNFDRIVTLRLSEADWQRSVWVRPRFAHDFRFLFPSPG